MDKHSIIKNSSLIISVILTLIIFINSVNTFDAQEKLAPPIINIHLLSYFILAVSWYFYFTISKFEHPYLLGFLIAFSFGLFIEVIQFFLPYRGFEIYDIGSNFLGAFSCLIVTPLENKIKKL